MEKYYKEFEDTEENKLIYMDIFKEYVRSRFIEKYPSIAHSLIAEKIFPIQIKNT